MPSKVRTAERPTSLMMGVMVQTQISSLLMVARGVIDMVSSELPIVYVILDRA